MIPADFYNAIAKEFHVDPERLVSAAIALDKYSAPELTLTIIMNEQQAKALHFIKEAV
jgi:hypothetical protein